MGCSVLRLRRSCRHGGSVRADDQGCATGGKMEALAYLSARRIARDSLQPQNSAGCSWWERALRRSVAVGLAAALVLLGEGEGVAQAPYYGAPAQAGYAPQGYPQPQY